MTHFVMMRTYLLHSAFTLRELCLTKLLTNKNKIQMAVKYFKKEYSSGLFLGSFGVGKFDDEQSYNDEGIDFLAKMVFIDIDKDCIRVQEGSDFVDADEVNDLNLIEESEFQKWYTFYDDITKKAISMCNNV